MNRVPVAVASQHWSRLNDAPFMVTVSGPRGVKFAGDLFAESFLFSILRYNKTLDNASNVVYGR